VAGEQSSIGPDGKLYYTGEGFDPTPWGGAPYDPSAPLGSNAAVPPPPPDGGMSVMPDQPPSVNASMGAPSVPAAPTNTVSLDQLEQDPAQAQQDAAAARAQQQAQAQAQRAQLNSMSAKELYATTGMVRTGGRAAQEFIPEHWQNAQRQGAYDAQVQKEILGDASVDQQLANQGMVDAAREQNNAAILAARQEQAAIERQQLEQARKNAAMREQADADRGEWERQKSDYEKAVGNGDAILGTPGGALSTIFGMLAIGLAARGSRENLNSTIAAVNGNIDRQVQSLRAQTKAKGDIADNAYSRYLRAYGNEEQAQAATRALMLDKAAKQVELTTLRARDPAIAAQGEQAAADIRARLADQMAIIEREAQGKVAEVYNLGQQARAAQGPGFRRATLEEELKYDDKLADTDGKRVENEAKAYGIQKTKAEIGKLNRELKPGGDDSKVAKDNSEPLKKVSEIDAALGSTKQVTAELRALRAAKTDTGYSTGDGGLFGGNVVKRAYNEHVNPTDSAENFRKKVKAVVPVIGRALTGAGYSDADVANAISNLEGSGTEEALAENLASIEDQLGSMKNGALSTMTEEGRDFYARQQSKVVPPPNPVQKVK
jgi:hypothetical protein